MEKFIDIQYLNNGSYKQRSAYRVIKNIRILDILREFNPILVGTIPINIDLGNSDLDIICEVYNNEKFIEILKNNFSHFHDFKVNDCKNNITANFWVDELEFEIYGEPLDSKKQNGYRHMVAEDRVLALGGEGLRKEIINLKKSGLKTEPAFAKLLNLKGNPYEEILKLEVLNDDKIMELIKNNN